MCCHLRFYWSLLPFINNSYFVSQICKISLIGLCFSNRFLTFRQQHILEISTSLTRKVKGGLTIMRVIFDLCTVSTYWLLTRGYKKKRKITTYIKYCSIRNGIIWVSRSTGKFDKGKVHPQQSIYTQRGIRSIALLILNEGAEWVWVVNAMPLSLYPQERDPVPIV